MGSVQSAKAIDDKPYHRRLSSHPAKELWDDINNFSHDNAPAFSLVETSSGGLRSLWQLDDEPYVVLRFFKLAHQRNNPTTWWFENL
jgi:hypothetical protein